MSADQANIIARLQDRLSLAEQVINDLSSFIYSMPTAMGDLIGQEAYSRYLRWCGDEPDSDNAET